MTKQTPPEKTITDDEILTFVQEFVGKVACDLALIPRWKIKIRLVDDCGLDEDGRGVAARIMWARHYLSADISINRVSIVDDIKNDRLDDVRTTLHHELVHLLFAEVDDLLADEIGTGYVFAKYSDARERMVDAISNLIVERGGWFK